MQLAGYDLIEAANGADALRLVRDAQPQLVLLDGGGLVEVTLAARASTTPRFSACAIPESA